ncbi:WD40-like beta Propeller [Candidatus Koribacter versatilis Ellin345]|uniref:WD40-like beta Propeller n=1 Tax=Koribacter versatilis (strain Ellin345) TaxID=204669 RepID=Q1IL81_KORVE|nr:WD40-like beta Propeller [Candidatus Koribacter versatilis Ellin345]
MSGPVAQERQGVYMISVIGASLKKLRDDAFQASLSPDGSQIVYLDSVKRSIGIMNSDGSQAHDFLKPEGGYRLFGPTWISNGKRILYVRQHSSLEGPTGALESRDLNAGDPQVLLSDLRVTFATYEQPGRIIFSMSEAPPRQYERNLYELRYNVDTGKPKGKPQQLTNWNGYSFTDFHATSDGNHFVFLNGKLESAVYLAELGNNNTELKAPQRLTLNAAINWFGSWSPDGKNIVFTSNRDGNYNIYVQGIQERSPRALASGPEEQLSPVVSPDGKWVLYVQWPKVVAPKLTVTGGKVMRVPIAGGAPEFVMDVKGSFTLDSDPITIITSIPNIRCPLNGDCLVAESGDTGLTFSAFDPTQGRKKEFGKAPGVPDFMGWNISPDGTQVATTEFDYKVGKVQIVAAGSATPQKFSSGEWAQLNGVSWSSDGKSLFLLSYSSRGTAVVHSDLTGHATMLYRPSWDIWAVQPSPDGKTLAFAPMIDNSNAWSMGYFPSK